MECMYTNEADEAPKTKRKNTSSVDMEHHLDVLHDAWLRQKDANRLQLTFNQT